VASQARPHLPSLLAPARWLARAKARRLAEPTRALASPRQLTCLKQQHNTFTVISSHG
jgi:DNA-binding transcriptional regulator PaaX